ncbi:MAG: Mur ligase family protein [bacterium]
MQKKIGILGFGVVGKSVLNFIQNFKHEKKILNLNQHNIDLNSTKLDIWDQKTFDLPVAQDLNKKEVGVFDPSTAIMKDFIDQHDYIIPSPGVNLNDFYSSSQKFICELDIFSAYFKKPVVAITGSLGKTTTTKLFAQLLSKIRLHNRSNPDDKKNTRGSVQTVNKSSDIVGSGISKLIYSGSSFNPFVGGNIGLGMLEAIQQQESFDVGVLELSSFQLEFSKSFAPDLAILMNCYPNHLDRHKSFKNYLDAKFNLFKYQTEEQFTLLPWHILQGDTSLLFAEQVSTLKSNLCFISDSPVDHDLPASVFSQARISKPYKIFYKQNNKLVLFDSDICHAGLDPASFVIFDLSVLPDITFVQNWILIISGLYLLGADLSALYTFFEQEGKDFAIDDHHHRVEYFATVRDVKFYDDSKATVIQSTLAAIKSLIDKGPVLLILGGLNKGVDRSPIIKELEQIKGLKKVYCYGPSCVDFGSASCNFGSLKEILQDISSAMQPGDQVLFSPSGTSFDLYQNYKHRGQVFKDLVLKLK